MLEANPPACDWRLVVLLRDPRRVCIGDAQDEAAPVRAREQPLEERSPGIAYMDPAGSRLDPSANLWHHVTPAAPANALHLAWTSSTR